MRELFHKTFYVFDFDGVLADSVDVKTRAFEQLYLPYGETIAKQVVEFHLNNGGVNRFDKIRHFHQEFLGESVDDQMVDSLAQKFSTLVVKNVIASDEIPGVSNVLEFCKDKAIRCAIDSATPEDELNQIVQARGLEQYFDFVFGAPVSKTDNLNKIIEQSGASLNDVVFFGDSSSDLAAARSVGVDFVGINYFSALDRDFLCYQNFVEFLAAEYGVSSHV